MSKFDSVRDSALHFLCEGEWSNDSTGDITSYGLYTWRISLTPNELSYERDEIGSLLEDWFSSNGVEDTPAFRESLVGHFLVSENSDGFVTVLKAPSATSLVSQFVYESNRYNAWLEANPDV